MFHYGWFSMVEPMKHHNCHGIKWFKQLYVYHIWFMKRIFQKQKFWQMHKAINTSLLFLMTTSIRPVVQHITPLVHSTRFVLFLHFFNGLKGKKSFTDITVIKCVLIYSSQLKPLIVFINWFFVNKIKICTYNSKN